MPDLAFPPVGRLGLTSPPSSVLCSATTATCPFRCPTLSLAHRYLACSFRSCPRLLASSLTLRNLCANAWPTWSPGTPFPGCWQGNKWLSQVPRLPFLNSCPALRPRWCPAHSPLTYPGLLPSATMTTSAFPSILTVILCESISPVHDYTNFEAQSRGLHSRSPWLRTSVTGLTRRVRY